MTRSSKAPDLENKDNLLIVRGILFDPLFPAVPGRRAKKALSDPSRRPTARLPRLPAEIEIQHGVLFVDKRRGR